MPASLKLNTSHFAEFANTYYKEGVFKIRLNSWDEFHGVVKIFNNNPDFIWRGQRCYPEEFDTPEDKEKWILKSKFNRRPCENRRKELNKILSTFKERLANLPNTYNIDFSKNDEIWAIGQHNGLPTPLLDWTKSPYIASYFAFYKNGEKQTNNRVIYVLNRVVSSLIIIEKDNKTKKELSRKSKIQFDFDIVHFSPEHHLRFINQKGAFTKAYKDADIKSTVKEFWKKKSKKNKSYSNKIILAEILLPDRYKRECLNNLESMNINHGVLFPDYAGAVEITKIDLGIKDYCKSPRR